MKTLRISDDVHQKLTALLGSSIIVHLRLRLCSLIPEPASNITLTTS